ncbi:MAG TPA: carbohydrate ABC transporter permease [Aggregatilineaceae bacterium]|nr:carbohydrate ABC transporter permease [Aggregatilineaceae bacterium]
MAEHIADQSHMMMHHRAPARTLVAKYVSLLLVTALLIIVLFPLFVIVLNSFKTETEYTNDGPLSMPNHISLDNIRAVWERLDYTIKLRNSLFISSITAVVGVLLSLFNAFALGIGRIKGRLFFLIFFAIAITLPQEALAYPLYYMFKEVGLYDSRWSIIIIFSVLHSAFGTYLLSSVFSAFPMELMEAAVIDGCNKLQLLFRIVVPISWPSLSVLFVFFFIWTWNEFFLPLIFLVSNANQTVPLAVSMFQGQRGAAATFQSTAALLGVLPCLIFFILFQRTLAKGIVAGSIK